MRARETIRFGGSIAGFACGVTRVTVIVVVVLGFIAILTAGNNAFALLVARPICIARQAIAIAATCCTTGGAGNAFLTLFVRIVTVRAIV